MTLRWQAVDPEGNVLDGIPAGSIVGQLQGWIEDRHGNMAHDSAVIFSIPEGAEARAFIRHSSEMGGTTETGYQPTGNQLSILSLSWTKDEQAEWLWLFGDGTVVKTAYDPGEKQWGWEDFLTRVHDMTSS
jgi:hypothetical protein